jgi:hypothetical protein
MKLLSSLKYIEIAIPSSSMPDSSAFFNPSNDPVSIHNGIYFYSPSTIVLG